jgi:GAF domain-containing protein
VTSPSAPGSYAASEPPSLTATTFLDIIETVGGTFDVVRILSVLAERCVDLLQVAASGILLADCHGRLQVIGASREDIQLLELFQIQNDAGPCVDCYRSGTIVANAKLDEPSDWPRFAAASVKAGFPSVCAIPLRFNDAVLGCLNLFMATPAALPDTDIALARALADFASIAIVQNRKAREAELCEVELRRALHARTVVEQAKGMIAGHGGFDLDIAASMLRAVARANGRGVTEVAEAIVARRASLDSLIPVRGLTHHLPGQRRVARSR